MIYAVYQNRYVNVGLCRGHKVAEGKDFADAEKKMLSRAKEMGHKNPRVIEDAISVPGDFYLEIIPVSGEERITL